MSEVIKVALVYKEIYEEVSINIYYLTNEDGFVYTIGSEDPPFHNSFYATVTRQEAIEHARTEIDALFNYETPKTEELWHGILIGLMESDEQGIIDVKNKRALVIVLNRYVEWKQSLPTK